MKRSVNFLLSALFVLGLTFWISSCEKPSTDTTAGAEFEGTWIIIDRNGVEFEITLDENGDVRSTRSPLDKGKWKVVGEKNAYIEWNYGTNEFIIINQTYGAERQTFLPNKSTEAKPDTVTQIEKRKA